MGVDCRLTTFFKISKVPTQFFSGFRKKLSLALHLPVRFGIALGLLRCHLLVPLVGATEGAPPRVANSADFADPPDLRGEVAQLVRATES